MIDIKKQTDIEFDKFITRILPKFFACASVKERTSVFMHITEAFQEYIVSLYLMANTEVMGFMQHYQKRLRSLETALSDASTAIDSDDLPFDVDDSPLKPQKPAASTEPLREPVRPQKREGLNEQLEISDK